MNLSRHHYRSGTAGGKHIIFMFSILIVVTSIGSNADRTASNSSTLRRMTEDIINRKPHGNIRGGSIRGRQEQLNNTSRMLSMKKATILEDETITPKSISTKVNICEEVVLSNSLVLEQQGDGINFANNTKNMKSFHCIMDGAEDASPRRLKIHNIPSIFQDEWIQARKAGMKRLQVSRATIHGDDLFLPDKHKWNDYTRRWQLPLFTPNPSPSRRKLAVDQNGQKTVLVICTKVTYNSAVYETTSNAADISKAIFGSVLGDISMKSQLEGCSYGKLQIDAANPPNAVMAATGVIGIEVVNPTGLSTTEVAQAVNAQIGNQINFDNYDHIMYHFPPGLNLDDDPAWIAWGEQPGKYSFYNDDKILDVQTLVHEVSHNFGLFHSGKDSDPYGDTSGYMGAAVANTNSGVPEARKCFNAAKSFELGWYTSPNRVATFNPVIHEHFNNGRLIGVADYGTSSSETYTVVLKIVNPSQQGKSYYLTYNRQKGINADVTEGADKVMIVKSSENEVSWLVEELSPGDTHTFPDFHNGRDLTITLGLVAQNGDNGDLDYVPITVAQETITCSQDSTCQASLVGTCASAFCHDDLTCRYETIDNCCGDGYCDDSENCSNCPADCQMMDACSEVDSQNDLTIIGSSSNNAYGIMFDIEALDDLSFYELEADLLSGTDSTTAKIYTMLNTPTVTDYNDLRDWDLIFDGQASDNNFHKVTMAFMSNMTYTAKGSKRKFYITYPATGLFLYGDNGSYENTNVRIDAASIRGGISGGNTVGVDIFNQEKSFLGGLRYKYENLIPIVPGLPGSGHLKELNSTSTKSLAYNEDSTLILSLSHSGDVLAVSGVAGDEEGVTSYAHYFKICIFKKNPSTGEFEPVGQPIINDVDSYFKDDARADVSLSGDGKMLAVSVVHKARHNNFVDNVSSGFVKLYTHSLEDISQTYAYLKTMYEGTAGGGGLEIGLLVSLDMYGDKLIIGEQYYDGSGNSDFLDNRGMVRVFNVNDKTQIGSTITGDTSGGDYAGSSVMLSKNGQCIIYGTVEAADATVSGGQAHVYCLNANGDGWILRSTLHAEQNNDKYGHSVAITSDGDYVAVSAIENDVGRTKIDAGHVRVFCFDGVEYVQLGNDIDGSEGQVWKDRYYVGDSSGFDIAMSDVNEDGIIRIVIGSPNNQDGGYYFGEVRVFEWKVNFSTEWTQVGESIYGQQDWAGLGYSVVIDNTGKEVAVSFRQDANGAAGVGVFVSEESSAAPSVSPSDYPFLSTSPSTTPTLSLMPSSSPTSYWNKDFQIRSNYYKYNSTVEWCAGPESLTLGTLFKNRPCEYPAKQDTQVFKRESTGQIKLSRITDSLCWMKTGSFKITLETCDGAADAGDAQKFILDDDGHTLTMSMYERRYLVGFEVDRKYSRLRLYREGSNNESIIKWETKYGPVFD